MRVHEMPIAQIGAILGLVAGIGGMLGTYGGGFLSDKLANRHGELRWHIWVPLISTVAAIPFYWFSLLIADTGVAAAVTWFVPSVIGGMYLGPCLATTHGTGWLAHARPGVGNIVFCAQSDWARIGPHDHRSSE